MSIPSAEALMLPLLSLLDDGRKHTLSDLVDRLADDLKLTPEERTERLPKGSSTRIKDRVHWARVYMSKAGLIENVSRGTYQITRRGADLLTERPLRIDDKLLARYPEFAEFQQRRSVRRAFTNESSSEANATITTTPSETLEESYWALRAALVDELLAAIRTTSPDFFERLVVDLLVAMGYGGSHGDVVQAFGRSGDDGIDGIIKEDRLGLDFVYVQAKRWSSVVGRPLVQGFAGSLEGQRARKGVFITTSTFSKEAHDYVTRIEKRIVLIDGDELANLMIDYGVGVADVTSYQIKRVDLDYFAEE